MYVPNLETARRQAKANANTFGRAYVILLDTNSNLHVERADAFRGEVMERIEPDWRTWDQLTSGERFDVMHAENPPTLQTALQSLWQCTADGWRCRQR